MEFYGLLTFFGIMLLLAALPSGSVGFVVVSSATRGLPCGVAAGLGIVAGDLIFVSLALLGMTALAETMGSFFVGLRYLGGAYLIWMGIGLLRSAGRARMAAQPVTRGRLIGSFNGGLILTLGDLKAILFYASLFPLCVDLAVLTAWRVALIVVLTVLAVGGVKLGYALAANRIAVHFGSPRLQTRARRLAGGALIGAGGVLWVKG